MTKTNWLIVLTSSSPV